MSQNDRPRLRAFTFLMGVLTLLVGLLMLVMPATAKMGGEWILATLMIGGAIMSAGFAATALRQDVRVYTSLLATLSLATGVTILVHPLDTFITLTTLLGIYFMLESGLFGGLGLSLRPNWSATGLLLMIGAISFVLSALIWLRLAGAPKTVIVGLLGISFIARGAAYVALSIMMKGRAPLQPASQERKSGEVPGEA